MEDYRIPEQTTIGWAALRVADIPASLAFYEDVVGLLPASRPHIPSGLDGQPGVAMAVDRASAPILYLTADPRARSRPERTSGLYHTAIRYPSPAGLAQALRRMAVQHNPLGGAADHGVSEALYTSDPDGNGVELYADRPRSSWTRENGHVAMVTEQLDLDGLLELVQGKPAEQAAPQGTVIGHMHLQVADLARSRAFYHGLLGLDVTQESYPGALFLSAGGYHHHIGLNVWTSRGAPPPPEGSLGLAAYSIRLPDETSWQELIGRAEVSGTPVERGELDGKPIAFLSDPDGMRVALVFSQSPATVENRAAAPADRARR
ncbi:MAG TPA: VOC family protein [Anaerolineaceae bacterium]|jgi:catechol 2,3-dioxygenase